MRSDATSPAFPEADDDELPITPLSAEQAQRLRERHRPVSPWQVVGSQVAVGLLAALVAWAWTGKPPVAWSVAYGALAVAVPAGVFARALARRAAASSAGAGWMAWELVKIGLTVALLVAAPRVVAGLDWLGLLVGVILATKMYWVALALWRRTSRTEN